MSAAGWIVLGGLWCILIWCVYQMGRLHRLLAELDQRYSALNDALLKKPEVLEDEWPNG